jgi:microcystin-dependent protein
MPRNSNGSYTLPQSPFVPGTKISSSAVNSDFSDIATALTQSVASTGVTPISSQIPFFAGSSASPGVTFGADTTTGLYLAATGELGMALAGSAGFLFESPSAAAGAGILGSNGAVIRPIGEVTFTAGSAVPSGWFLADGQAISRASYPELFSVIGTTYGSGDGSTTFNLPDLRGRALAGIDNMGGTAANRLTAAGFGGAATSPGATGGAQTVTLSTGQLPTFTPSGSVSGSVGGSATPSGSIGASQTLTNIYEANSAGALGFLATGGVSIYGIQNEVISGSNFSFTGNAISGSSFSWSGSFSGNAIGSGTAVPVVQPTMVMNAIIFAGHP